MKAVILCFQVLLLFFFFFGITLAARENLTARTRTHKCTACSMRIKNVMHDVQGDTERVPPQNESRGHLSVSGLTLTHCPGGRELRLVKSSPD